MAVIAEEALARNAWRVEWAVLDWNVRAIKFYDRLGAKQNTWLHYGLDEGEIRKLAGG
jgi:hypothetical protein